MWEGRVALVASPPTPGHSQPDTQTFRHSRTPRADTQTLKLNFSHFLNPTKTHRLTLAEPLTNIVLKTERFLFTIFPLKTGNFL